jgi:hypothetical protein
MRRRLAWIQGAGAVKKLYLKILLGSSTEGTAVVSNGVELQTVSYSGSAPDFITATGPDPDDWSVAIRPFVDSEFTSVGFVGPNGITAAYPSAEISRGRRIGGHFVSAAQNTDANSLDAFLLEWFTPSGSGSGGFTSFFGTTYGYVLPNVLEGGRLANNDGPTQFNPLNNDVHVSSNYSHALFRGNNPFAGFSSGDPWIVDAAGNFTRTAIVSNSMIGNRRILGITWPYLYYNSSSFTDANIFLGGDPGIRELAVQRYNLETEEIDFVVVQAFDPGGFVGSGFLPTASVA